MKNMLFAIVGVIIVFCVTSVNAQNQENETIEYQGVSFELPMSLKEATKSLELNKNSEGSLRNGGINSRKLLVHPKSDSRDTIIGITFYDRCFNRTELKALHIAYFESFEEHYKAKFKAIEFEFFTSLDGNYYYLELENNLILVLGDVMYNAAENNYITVSYFKGVDVKELPSYLDAIY